MYDPCPVCASRFTSHVREVPTRRTKRQIGLYTCLECSSFWNPSGYHEDEAQLARDLEWGKSVTERNKRAATRLFDCLRENGVKPQSVAEIGCGIGTLLTVARSRGMRVIGYDVNKLAIAHARDANGLDAHAEMWTSETELPPIDLFLCISVLEHVEQPRPLIQELCKAAAAHKAALFISVPFLDRDKWDFIVDPAPEREHTPFFDNDVHVVHFSVKGLGMVMAQSGLKDTKLIKAGLWDGLLWTPG